MKIFLPGGADRLCRRISVKHCGTAGEAVASIARRPTYKAEVAAHLNRSASHSEENAMYRRTALTLTVTAALCVGVSAFGSAVAQQFGTADDAKAMLAKTVAALKADKIKTLDLINKGEGGFLDRDIYPFCFNKSDGINQAVASPNAKQFLGKDIRENKDATGKQYGLELFAAAQKPEGQITEVS